MKFINMNFWGDYAKKIKQNVSRLYEEKKIKARKIYMGQKKE